MGVTGVGRDTKISIETTAAGGSPTDSSVTVTGSSIVTNPSGSHHHALGDQIEVELVIASSEGPVAEGSRITGCNLVTQTGKKCFGATQGENFVHGILFLVIGLPLMCWPCIGLFFCAAGISKMRGR